MRPSHKRLALAAAIGGAAIAATPALANAASTCTYSPPSGLAVARVVVFDGSGGFPLFLQRSGGFIAVQDAGGTPKLCPGPAGEFATVLNTDRILVHGTASASESVPFVIDQSAGTFGPGKTPESDGNSEIETIISNNGVQPNMLVVNGTGGPDTMRVAAGGNVMLGSDNDLDIQIPDHPSHVELNGGGGNDYLSGRGGYPFASPAPATTRLDLFGGDGDDTLVDGPQRDDNLVGDAGNDTLYTVDGQSDFADGGLGFDTATIDGGFVDAQRNNERLTAVAVGRLKLDRTALEARAGRPVRLTLAWKHPKAWKQLRSLQLTANDAGNVVGSIRIDPASGRISNRGALQARGSTVTHHGKWVTAHLRLRPGKRLAGHSLRLAVQATDMHGHKQLEPAAGSLTVTR